MKRAAYFHEETTSSLFMKSKRNERLSLFNVDEVTIRIIEVKPLRT